MERIAYQALLYDFYGELLTEHQKNIYEDYCLNDLSLSEIGEENKISRQGVHDIIKRCNKMLEGYEESLHLIAKFNQTKKDILEIGEIADEIQDIGDETKAELQNSIERILTLVHKIVNEL